MRTSGPFEGERTARRLPLWDVTRSGLARSDPHQLSADILTPPRAISPFAPRCGKDANKAIGWAFFQEIRWSGGIAPQGMIVVLSMTQKMQRLTQYLTSAVGFARKIFAVERLAEPEPQAVQATQRTSLLRLLFAVEPLPCDPPPPRQARPSLAKLLLAPESLPEDPPLARRRRSQWLRWLFAPERLDEE
jgi:hypothetical protein